MQRLVGILMGLTGASVTAWSCRVAAESATERGNDVAGGATNPQKTNPDVAVVFEATAADLPQAAIRDAVARELGGSPERTVLAARRELSIGVDGSDLVVRFTSPEDHAERRVARPADASQIPELVRLIAGNLARDQRPLVEPPHPREPERSTRIDAATDGVATAGATPSFRRHWVGLEIAQDLLWDSSAPACDPSPKTTYSCFLAGTNAPYRPSANSSPRTVASGFSVATTRLLVSYDYAFTPAFSVGGRAGFAFRGGPNSESRATFDPPVSESAANLGYQPFLPLHLEARASWWFAPLTNERVRGFAGVGVGVMQIDAKQKYETTCGLSASDGTDGCTSPLVKLDVWQRVGRGFVDLRAGTELRLAGELGLEIGLNAVVTAPAFGFALEPSLGLVYGL